MDESNKHTRMHHTYANAHAHAHAHVHVHVHVTCACACTCDGGDAFLAEIDNRPLYMRAAGQQFATGVINNQNIGVSLGVRTTWKVG